MADEKRIAAIQMASGPNVDANLMEASQWMQKAAANGAKLVVLPENFACMAQSDDDLLEIREQEGQGVIQDFLAQQARTLGVWILGGTIPLAASNANKLRAASLLYDSDGQMVARYDKIHLFDVDLPCDGEHYEESKVFEPGEQLVVVDTPVGRLGMSVCYDVRFPELYRAMLDQGVEVLAIPAAFTAQTGKAHWEVLMRARAIENLAYVVSAGQGGYHVNGRETYGDSMVVDPWGQILERLPKGPGQVSAEVNSGHLGRVRERFPVLKHRQFACASI